jgi:hypothetical protein
MTTQTTDRKATDRELAAASRRIMRGGGGPGLVVAAARIGVTQGWLSRALRGKTVRRLLLSELRAMQEAQ